MPRHLRALQSLLAATDADRYVDSARGADAEVLTRQVYPLERSFEILDNYVVELAKIAVEFVGEQPDDAVRNLRRLGDLGAIPRSRAERLVDVHRIRNDLAHQYANARGRLLFEAAEILEREVGPFMQSFTPWFISQLGPASDS